MTSEDGEAIRTLLAGYCLAIDGHDSGAWAGCFTDDGVFDMGRGDPPIVGRDALRAFCDSIAGMSMMHVCVNPVIEVDGDDATCVSYVLVYAGDGDPRVVTSGRYQDRFRRVDGTWLLADRRLEPLL